MRFVKQRRSRSLRVQSRLSNLGLRCDRYYWSKVLLGGKKIPPLSPWFLRFNCSISFTTFTSFSFTYLKKQKKKGRKWQTRTDTHSCPTSWMDVILSDLSVPSHKLSHNPSLSSLFILCARNLNRWSPFDSVLFLPLSLWAAASSYLPFLPRVPWHPFLSCPCCDSVAVCITLCRVLLSTYDFTRSNIRADL